MGIATGNYINVYDDDHVYGEYDVFVIINEGNGIVPDEVMYEAEDYITSQDIKKISKNGEAREKLRAELEEKWFNFGVQIVVNR